MSTTALPTVIERTIGNEKLILETGKLAFQAHGSVTLRYGETILLATAVMSDKPRADIDFLPLTVEYEERLYAAGKIPGSFFRREGRPGQEAILSARLTDRSIRPLFPKSLHNEIQVILTILSAEVRERLADREVDIQLSDAASAALVEEGYDPEYGARPLRRVVERRIENELARRILSGEFRAGDCITVDYADGEYVFGSLAPVEASS